MAETEAGRRVGAAVRAVLDEAARYIELVTAGDPHGSAAALLHRPDVGAVLQEALSEAQQAAADAVADVWASHGAPETPALSELLADVDRQLSSLAHLHGLITHAHAQAPPDRRAAAVRAAVLKFGRESGLRSRLTYSVAAGAARTEAVLAAGYADRESGKVVLKRWRAHVERPQCCHWCRKLNGVTVGLDQSFLPFLGGPVRLRSQALTHPPRPYRGQLQGPLLHPFCECRLEIVLASNAGHESVGEGGGRELVPPSGAVPPSSPVTALAAADIRALSEEKYRALHAWLSAAIHELGLMLERLAGLG